LKPYFDLRLGEAQGGRELRPLGDGEVLPLTELALKGEQLLGRERSPRLAVRLVLSEKTFVWADTGRTAQT